MAAAPPEAQVDATVDEAFAAHALADTDGLEQIDRAVLEHAGTNALLAIRAAAQLEHDRCDPGPPQQHREHEPGRSRTDDPDLRARGDVLGHRVVSPRGPYSVSRIVAAPITSVPSAAKSATSWPGVTARCGSAKSRRSVSSPRRTAAAGTSFAR